MAMRRENVAAALRYLQDKADLRGRFQRATSLDPQEQDLADIAVETGASLVPGVGPALAARDFERARRADDPVGMGMAAASAVPGGKLAGLLKRYDPTRLELDVYHGTPHRFPATEANPLGEFDASKIGTGEGAQAYGHGIYYAENPEVAKGYQPRDPKAEAKLMNLYKQAEARQNYDAMEVLEAAMLHRTASELREQYPNQKALVNRIGKINEKAAGALYKADLPDEMIDRMLDWDKPIREQPKSVQNIARRVIAENLDWDDPTAKAADEFYDATGADLYQALESKLGSKQTSDYFRQAGLPGVRYLDAGSRGQGGSGTRNFVVFPGEEKKVRILERDGKRVAEMLQRTAPGSAEVEVDLYPLRGDSNTLYLSKIVVPEGQRGQGLGTKAMQDVIARADAEGKRVVLSPSTEYGATSVGRLKDFYKRFGFVENKGRNKNYAVSQTMYRDPQKAK
jgi:GNAT superfamily N-acetyltransferase